ncbi:organic cation transporter protein-like [Zerene cesonia]|uniref:organic cation transporter protein-like n=1 Tax=Zerene cesonia TaxID=33412 RepID=UPI0018E586C4|nr:organic cation transporter protein-like [Zerene cesonia]
MSPKDERKTETEFEDVLNREVGQFGKFQLINILLMGLPAIASGFLAGDYNFAAARLPFRCAIPECDGDSPVYAPDWILNAIPETSTGFADCTRYAGRYNTSEIPNNTCPIELFDKSEIIPCDGYVYERTNSLVYDFGLECQEWIRTLSITLNSVGAMVALPVAGWVSDYFGRRVSIVLFAFNVVVIGIIKAFSTNYIMYLVTQFLHTALGGGVFSAAYILAAEIVGPKYRVTASVLMSTMFALGLALVGAIASAVSYWRHLTLIYFVPMTLILTYYWILCESHRWLLSKHKNDKAKIALERAANLNGKKISDEAMIFLLSAIPRTNETETNKNLIMRVLKSPVMLRRSCTTPIFWIATTFIYYGMTINSVSLSGNMYVNYILVALVEIPGFWTAYFTLDRLGRRLTLFSGFALCAACCMGFAFTPHSRYGLSLFLYLVGKYCTGLIMTSVYLFTSELYPTRHRHSFLGFSSMLGRLGTVVASFTPPLMDYWTGIPSVMFGTVCIITALLVLTQPETLGQKVPDTFEDAEVLGKI